MNTNKTERIDNQMKIYKIIEYVNSKIVITVFIQDLRVLYEAEKLFYSSR